MNYLHVEYGLADWTFRPDLCRQVDAQGKKGERLAHKYERELNGGYCYATDKRKEGFDPGKHFFVYYEPYSQAREWLHFDKWADNPEYPETEEQ